jgi:hypothetical protein
MDAQSRCSPLLCAAEIAVRYSHLVVAVAGGLLVLPFTGILLGLFSLLVVQQLIVAIPVVLIVFGIMQIALSRVLIGICRRLLASDPHTGKPSFRRKVREPKSAETGLWDEWIDWPDATALAVEPIEGSPIAPFD